MGAEIANIHFGSQDVIKNVRHDLNKLSGRWLHEASKTMAKAVENDWEEWRK
jgi:hypothetical protein